jgi:hypothetical protein
MILGVSRPLDSLPDSGKNHCTTETRRHGENLGHGFSRIHTDQNKIDKKAKKAKKTKWKEKKKFGFIRVDPRKIRG